MNAIKAWRVLALPPDTFIHRLSTLWYLQVKSSSRSRKKFPPQLLHPFPIRLLDGARPLLVHRGKRARPGRMPVSAH